MKNNNFDPEKKHPPIFYVQMTIKDKIIWITGASSGIGKALAIEAAKEGAKLILSARNTEALATVQQLCLQHTPHCQVLHLDLTEISKFPQLTQEALGFFKRIDVLVNNGGISQRSLVEETDLTIDRKIMEVDYFGAVALTKSVLPHMLQQKSGHIVVISSVTGIFGFPLRSAYAAAKHALHGFFETLRAEVMNRNVGVTIVCPGRIKTGISYHALTKDGKAHGKMDAGQAKGIPADVCARKILTAVKKGKKEIYIARGELVLIYLKRFFPALFYNIVTKINPT
jgi:short-subunit dehydrogenase